MARMIRLSSTPSFLAPPPNYPLRRVTALRFRTVRKRPFASEKPHLVSASASTSSKGLEVLVFDCDGVILESEHLHRQAYNDAFAHFNVRCASSSQPLNWASDVYDVLQNRIGGGKAQNAMVLPTFSLLLMFLLIGWGLGIVKVLWGARVAVVDDIRQAAGGQ
ncbi:hypothetical protein FH972_002628 [Carpinus fangiana]|uniref:Uncharacterized protein n=1 Tax=Carpinus fangiana TaxID=176857 RepID=A0A5N6QIW5_9ROSI|nr:hypothetical protein FH972_002628 [Carpinus fangiana]